MPLPRGGNDAWPPPAFKPFAEAYAEWSAWYSGDPQQLADVYGGDLATVTRRSRLRFWQRTRETRTHRTRGQLHVPLAGDIAATSASLLFGETPEFVIPEAHIENAMPAAKATQARLDEIIHVGGVLDRLSEAAESCAALGGVYLKPDWDTDLADVPLLSVVQADNAVPEFRYGLLTAVTCWKVVEGPSRDKIYRHLERHSGEGPGGAAMIEHALYEGSREALGERVALERSPATAALQDRVILPFRGLGIRYIANMRPNRRFRGTALGQSDYAGSEGLFDALDETYTSWMRDIRLARGRIIVPEEFLDRQGDEFRFDLDEEVFVGVEMAPDAKAIEAVQFAIRVTEHQETALDLVERIISHAGYAPQTFGLHIEGRAESGTALRIRERKSLSTQQRKRRYWEPGVADVLEMMLRIDQVVFRNTRIEPTRPQVNMADSIQPDPQEVAATIELLNRAAAISLYEKVRLQHPDWKQAQIQEEVDRLQAEQGLPVEDPLQVGMA